MLVIMHQGVVFTQSPELKNKSKSNHCLEATNNENQYWWEQTFFLWSYLQFCFIFLDMFLTQLYIKSSLCSINQKQEKKKKVKEEESIYGVSFYETKGEYIP